MEGLLEEGKDAQHLGHAKVAKPLQQALDEESAADEMLSAISLKSVLPHPNQNGEYDK